MIQYKFDEEREFALHYARQLDDKRVLEILQNGRVANRDDAIQLSRFFWKMVDASIAEEQSGDPLPWDENAEFWNEKLLYSFSGYLQRAGFEDAWDEVSDQQP